MKILIINLDRETERMAFQETQMLRLGLQFERLPAITVTDIDQTELAVRAEQWERPMRHSEVACLFSHREAWKIVAAGNGPILILEDDALLSTKTPQILTALENLDCADHVSLEIRSRQKLLDFKSKTLCDNTVFTRLYQDRSGAAAYILWPKGARKLLNRSDRAAGLSDAIIAAAYEMSSWQIEPAAAMQLDQCQAYGIAAPLETTSTIGVNSSDKPRAKTFASLFVFKRRRIASQLRMGLRKITNIHRARHRYAKVEIDDFRSHIGD